jgi:integrase
VTLDGRDHYLGRHGTTASRVVYDRLVAEWQTRKPVDPCPTINEIIVRYMEFARSYYRKAGLETAEVANIRLSLRPLQDRFGALRVVDFGPRALKLVRQDILESGVSRLEINRRVGRIRRMFRWAVAEELIPVGIVTALETVADLKRGRTEARENPPVTAVPEAHVDAIRPFVSRPVWAMIELQRLTAMRPGEVTIMRTGDLDVTGRIWIYRPSGHKMEHTGRTRTVHLGPRAQEILRPWLRPDLEAFLFQPQEAEAERKAELRQGRKTKVQPSQRDRSKPDPKKRPGERYDTRSYAHAIHGACRTAGVPIWGPNRLRHLAATTLRREFGLDTAQVVLGHASPDTTLIYAEADRQRAAEAMLRIG